MSRPVLVHYHIFKNAGTSVDWMLQQSFGAAWAAFEGQHASDVQPVERVRAFLDAHPHVVALSSHLARPPLPWSEAKAIVYVRHPVERARSVYAFVAKDPTQPNHSVARDRGFAGYVRWALGGGDGGVVIRNYQVVHLSAASLRPAHVYHAEATPNDLREATNYLDAWDGVGVVSRFAESCRAIQQALLPTFPGLRLDPVRLNTTAGTYESDEQRLQKIEDALGRETYERLLAANELDLALHTHANRSLDRRVAAVAAAATKRG